MIYNRMESKNRAYRCRPEHCAATILELQPNSITTRYLPTALDKPQSLCCWLSETSCFHTRNWRIY